MLVLTRKTNEKIVINGDITVTVLEIKGSRIRIGISAPGDVPIQRAEIALDGPVAKEGADFGRRLVLAGAQT